MADIFKIREAAKAAALSGRPMQLSTEAACKLAHLLDTVENAAVGAISFINSEYASDEASAMDGDPIERGQCRDVRDRLCEVLAVDEQQKSG